MMSKLIPIKKNKDAVIKEYKYYYLTKNNCLYSQIQRVPRPGKYFIFVGRNNKEMEFKLYINKKLKKFVVAAFKINVLEFILINFPNALSDTINDDILSGKIKIIERIFK